ncbi:MAG: chemotaxis protein CheX [Desulfuromonadales bacterium]
MSINQAVIEHLNMTEDALVECMVSNMGEIFYRMARIENVAQKPRIIDPINVFTGCITALVGLAGEFSGLLSLHLPDVLAKDFTSGMLGSPVTEINRDVHDAIGELALMIAGSCKYHLGNHGNNIHLSTPSTFTGGEYYFNNSAPDDSLAILCDVGDQWFMLSLTLKQT